MRSARIRQRGAGCRETIRLQAVLWSVSNATNPFMAATNITYKASERRRFLFRRIVRDFVFGMLPPVATIILLALVVLVFGR